MRWLALICTAVISTSALAQSSVPSFLLPNAWSIGIALAQWMHKDTKKVFYVEVVADGTDLEDARRNAFRMAVERAVGTVVASETHVTNSRIQRDEIITYASGYVDDYQLVATNHSNGRTLVQMRVWVSHNKLANRLLNRSQADGAVEGGKISEQIGSIQYERAQGDRLLGLVMRDYPTRAFDINLRPTRVTLDADRQAVLHVEFDLSWNRHYIDSLATAIRTISQRKDCGNWFGDCRATTIIGGGGAVAGMDDSSAWHLMNQEMISSRPQILIRILDAQNQVRFRQCFGLRELDHSDYAPWRYVDAEPGRIRVNHQRSKMISVPIQVSAADARNLDRVDIQIVRQHKC